MPPASDPGVLMSYWPPDKLDRVLADATDASHGVLPAEEPLWESWFDTAVAAGVDEELARLGRSLIREAFMLRWHDHLREQAGWGDGGESMLELALSHPSLASTRWRSLLDGER